MTKMYYVSSCQFWNDKSVPLQILHHSSMSWNITRLYLFGSNNIYFSQKEPIKVNVFETFKCSGENLSNSFCQFWNDKSIPLQILYTCAVSRKLLLCTFLTQPIYTLLKRSTLKRNCLRLSSAQVKIRQIPHVSFDMTSQFHFKFCIIFHCYDM